MQDTISNNIPNSTASDQNLINDFNKRKDTNEVNVQAEEPVFPNYDETGLQGNPSAEKFNFLKDLQLNVYIELGRTQMQIKDILELERGYVIELDKLASEPVDIFVNNKKIAEGEVVVIDKHFGIRIINLVDVASKLKGMI